MGTHLFQANIITPAHYNLNIVFKLCKNKHVECAKQYRCNRRSYVWNVQHEHLIKYKKVGGGHWENTKRCVQQPPILSSGGNRALDDK